MDPYLRGWAVSNLSKGDLMTSGMVGTVVQSKHDQFREGDSVFCYAHWATVTQADPSDRKAQVFKLPDEKNIQPSAYLGCLVRTEGKQGDPADSRSLALSLAETFVHAAQRSSCCLFELVKSHLLTLLCHCLLLRVQGMPGATAYFGLKYAAPVKKDDVVLVRLSDSQRQRSSIPSVSATISSFSADSLLVLLHASRLVTAVSQVSSAAGAVGSMVAQLSKLWGAKRVVGSVSQSHKKQTRQTVTESAHSRPQPLVSCFGSLDLTHRSFCGLPSSLPGSPGSVL